MKCDYCNNQFATKSSLHYHQKTAKYCIELRGAVSDQNKCVGCKKIFCSKRSLGRHYDVCFEYKTRDLKHNFEAQLKHKDIEIQNKDIIMEKELQLKDSIIDDLKEQVLRLQTQLANIAEKSATRHSVQNNNSNNNNNNRVNQMINNLLPLTDEHINDQVQYLSLDHIKKGVEGYVEYALNHPLKDRIVCSDFSRRKIKYKNKDGIVVTDPEMTKLVVKLFKAIQTRNEELITEYMEVLRIKLFDNPLDQKKEHTEAESERSARAAESILAEVKQIQHQKLEVIELAKGSKPELYHNFVKLASFETVA